MFFSEDSFVQKFFREIEVTNGLPLLTDVEVNAMEKRGLDKSPDLKFFFLDYIPSKTLLTLLYNRNLIDNKVVTISYIYLKATKVFLAEISETVLKYNKIKSTDIRHVVALTKIEAGRDSKGNPVFVIKLFSF